MARFPKKLILVAALAELLILATTSRSEVLHPKPAEFSVNSISALSAPAPAPHHAATVERPVVKAKEALHGPQHVI